MNFINNKFNNKLVLVVANAIKFDLKSNWLSFINFIIKKLPFKMEEMLNMPN